MYTFLLVLLILDSIVLAVAILLQSGKGGLAASFGGASSAPDAFIGIRQAGNLLTTVSWWATGIFLALSFVLQIMSSRSRVPTSVLEGRLANPAPTTPAPSSAAPALPLEAAPSAPETPQTPPTQ